MTWTETLVGSFSFNLLFLSRRSWG